MIKTTMGVLDELKSYASPKARITRLLKSGSLVKLRRGLYLDTTDISPYALAPVIYGPSYVSFQTALAIYGLIPERVDVTLSASYNKDKDKVFRTPIGEYRYWYLPPSVYPYGILLRQEQQMGWLIASPEKALCDTVYKIPSVSERDIDALLFDDLRMERSDLANMDGAFISWIAPVYRRKTLASLARWFEREFVHG